MNVKNGKTKKILACFILACFILLMCLSAVIDVAHSGHNCTEKTCFVCSVTKLLKAFTIALSATVGLSVLFIFAAIPEPRRSFCVNLIRYKVRMNN
jgi:hypothetical protein